MSKIDELRKIVEAASGNINEEVDVVEVIKDLIDTNFSASEEEKGKAASLIRGLFFSKEPQAKKFIEKLDELTSSLDAKDFE